MSATLKQYRIKDDFKQLFSNLATGAAFLQHDAFLDLSKPQSRVYRDGDMARHHYEVLSKLVEAGLVEELDTAGDVLEGEE